MLVLVFSEEDKEKLIKYNQGFICVQKFGDIEGYLFECDAHFNFAENDIKYVISNRITF